MKRWFWLLDASVVFTFVIIGRDTHGFAVDWAEIGRVALPFLIALAVGIVLTRAWLNPTNWLVGLGIAAVTALGGLLLRHFVFGEGTATIFAMVTTGWMVLWMVGWRLIFTITERIVDRRRTSSAT